MTGTEPFTSAELVAAAEGREGAFLIILRDAIAKIEGNVRQRVLRDAAALGLDVETLSATLHGTAPAAAPSAKPVRAQTQRPTAPESDTALLGLLVAELDKGQPLSAKALARRTGASTDRVSTLLRANSGDHLRVDGLKWSRKAAS